MIVSFHELDLELFIIFSLYSKVFLTNNFASSFDKFLTYTFANEETIDNNNLSKFNELLNEGR